MRDDLRLPDIQLRPDRGFGFGPECDHCCLPIDFHRFGEHLVVLKQIRNGKIKIHTLHFHIECRNKFPLLPKDGLAARGYVLLRDEVIPAPAPENSVPSIPPKQSSSLPEQSSPPPDQTPLKPPKPKQVGAPGGELGWYEFLLSLHKDSRYYIPLTPRDWQFLWMVWVFPPMLSDCIYYFHDLKKSPNDPALGLPTISQLNADPRLRRALSEARSRDCKMPRFNEALEVALRKEAGEKWNGNEREDFMDLATADELDPKLHVAFQPIRQALYRWAVEKEEELIKLTEDEAKAARDIRKMSLEGIHMNPSMRRIIEAWIDCDLVTRKAARQLEAPHSTVDKEIQKFRDMITGTKAARIFTKRGVVSMVRADQDPGLDARLIRAIQVGREGFSLRDSDGRSFDRKGPGTGGGSRNDDLRDIWKDYNPRE